MATDPYAVGMSCVLMLSLSTTGTPCSGPRGSLSSCFARCNAVSLVVTIEFSAGSMRSIRSR